MEERKCSKCGGDGPFPNQGGRVCKKCKSAATLAWRKRKRAEGWKPPSPAYKKERDVAKVLRYKAQHPDRYHSAMRASQEKRRQDPAWRERWNIYQRERYHRKKKEQELMQNPKLQKIVQEVVQQAKQDGLDESDAKWMAVGAAIRQARNQGVVGEVLSPEMNAAAQALVEQELKKNGK